MACFSEFKNVFNCPDPNDDDICEEIRKYAKELARINLIPKALDVLQNAYDKRVRHSGEMNAKTLEVKYDIGEIFEAQREYDKALQIYEDIIKKSNRCLGENHSLPMQARFRIAVIYFEVEEYDKSYEINTALYHQQVEVLGKKHKSTLLCKRNIADVLVIQTKTEEALKIYQEVLEESRGVYGPSDYEMISLANIMDTLQPFQSRKKPTNETIHSLSRTGNLEKVASLIQTGVEINGKDSRGKTPLHWAVQFGHMETAKLLLKNGAKYNADDDAGNTPLQVTDTPDIRKLLLAIKGLFYGVKSGKSEKVLQQISKESWMLNIKDKDGYSALHWACSGCHLVVVKLLLEFGADASLVSDKGNSSLHIAALKGCSEVVELLVRSVARDKLHDFINGKTATEGNTPLHAASERGFVDVVKTLLSNGAAYRILNKRCETPLDVAKDLDCQHILKLVEGFFQDAEKGNADIICKLRDLNSSVLFAVTRAQDNDKRTLLQVLTVGNYTNLAGELLEILNSSEK